MDMNIKIFVPRLVVESTVHIGTQLDLILFCRQYDVAEPHHLFEALDAAAVEDGALAAYPGITIDKYFRTWSEKAGHPVLTVSINQNTGRMTVTQVYYYYLNQYIVFFLLMGPTSSRRII